MSDREQSPTAGKRPHDTYHDRQRKFSADDEPPRLKKLRDAERKHGRDSDRRSPRQRSRHDVDHGLRKQRRNGHDNHDDRDAHHSSLKRRSRSPGHRPSHRRHHSYTPSNDEREAQHRGSRENDRQHRRNSRYRRSHRSRSRSSSSSSSSSSSPPSRRQRSHDSAHRVVQPYKRSSAPLPAQDAAFRGDHSSSGAVDRPTEKQKPDFNRSGKLAAETNTVAGTSIVLKYNEPPEARKPASSADWRMYVFKGQETLETLVLGERTCWLFGRERAVADVPVEHPSCSKQHAVLQFRHVEKRTEFGDRKSEVRPYVIDLESANGTRVNGERIPSRKFWEVLSGDVLGFGDSSREYVVMLAPKG